MNIDRWAWDEFWREQLPTRTACMALAPVALLSELAKHWQTTASRFRNGARIVDLGCGNGTVGRWILEDRPDLSVIGVDFADLGFGPGDDDTPCTTGLRIFDRVAIENLPFRDGSIDGVVSQFGFEYCNVEEGAAEVARVLAPRAPISFITHNSYGPIAVDNIRSDRALRHLLSAPMKRAFRDADGEAVQCIVAALPERAIDDPTIQLLVSTLVNRLKLPQAGRMRSWDNIVAALRPEIALSAALERSAVAPFAMQDWLRPFRTMFDNIQVKPFRVGRTEIAWCVEARRRG